MAGFSTASISVRYGTDRKSAWRLNEGGGGPDAANRDSARLALARHLLDLHIRGNEIMGAEIIRDPRFDMVLELYIAHREHRPLCISGLCAATKVPQTTGLRHIASLERQEFLTRVPDHLDARRTWVVPTERGLMATDVYLDEYRRPV